MSVTPINRNNLYTVRQQHKLEDFFITANTTTHEMQNYLSNTDLLELMRGVDLSRVDRADFIGILSSARSAPYWVATDQRSHYQDWQFKIHLAERFIRRYSTRKDGFTVSNVPKQKPFDENLGSMEIFFLRVWLPAADGLTSLQRTYGSWLRFLVDETLIKKETLYDGLSGIHRIVKSKGVSQSRPGIGWSVLDAGANQGRSAAWSVEHSAPGHLIAGPEVLMALAQVPEWAEEMNGTSIPYPMLSGCRIGPSLTKSDEPWASPYVYGDERLELPYVARTFIDSPDMKFCSPTVRVLK